MRAASPPTAHPVAAAALALVAAVLAPLADPSTVLAERWLRPVPGEVARSFSYARDAPFTAGAHRGIDLAAQPGMPVRAVCAGRVVHAGAVAGRDDVVSVRCGDRRVSYLPLSAIAVRAGATIRAGAPIGEVAPGHGGLHLGVRREGDPVGYEDPMTLLRQPREPVAPAERPSPPRTIAPRPEPLAPRPAPIAPRPAPIAPRPAPIAPRRALERRLVRRALVSSPAVERPLLRPAPVSSPAVERPLVRPAPTGSPAPWPVWAGLAVLLCGAAGTGTAVARGRRVAHSRAPVAAAAP